MQGPDPRRLSVPYRADICELCCLLPAMIAFMARRPYQCSRQSAANFFFFSSGEASASGSGRFFVFSSGSGHTMPTVPLGVFFAAVAAAAAALGDSLLSEQTLSTQIPLLWAYVQTSSWHLVTVITRPPTKCLCSRTKLSKKKHICS